MKGPSGSAPRSLQRTTTVDDAARELLQERAALFGGVIAALSGVFLAYRTVDALFNHGVAAIYKASMLAHAAAFLLMLTLWLVCRGAARSTRFVRRLEMALLVGAIFAFVAMGDSVPLYVRPEMIVLMAMSLTLFTRAVYVPSTTRNTLTIGLIAWVPLTLGVYLGYSRIDPGAWALVDAEFSTLSVPRIALGRSINVSVWWACVVGAAAMASRIVYGLRKEVKNAKRLGCYELEERLGTGGMGVVYRARHALLERPTAVKLLPPELAGDGSIARFEREVQLTARLAHPNTVTIFDYGRTIDGIFYYAMELIQGVTLEELVEVDGPQPASRVLCIMREIAGALVEAHGIGLIHRDIKPANVMLSLPHMHGAVDEVAKVLDFGLAKEINPESMTIDATATNALRGTPLYMPPEAIRSPGAVDERSDLYALGAVGYFLLTGEHVFEGATVIEVCSKHLYDDAPLASERAPEAVPAILNELIGRCLRKDPQARPQSAGELLDELRACDTAERWSADDAAGWWQRHGEDLQRISERRRSPLSRSRALAVTATRSRFATMGLLARPFG